ATISVFKITALTFDADGDDVVVSVSNGDPAVGSIQALADGTYRYVPAAASMGTLGVITDTVTITVTDGHGGIHTRTETVTLQSQWRATATGIPVTTIVGSGATAPNPAGGNYDLGGGLVIGGGSYGLGLDESGTNIVVTGPYTSPIFLPVVTEDGDVPWSVSETETTTSIFANGRLAVFLYLGEA
ncbi:MAG TPA: Ig-like domain-containing protein, partial [Mycobacterium sp.]|nr:Ig-like domain-containing protein [Mycobacterium sp.]